MPVLRTASDLQVGPRGAEGGSSLVTVTVLARKQFLRQFMGNMHHTSLLRSLDLLTGYISAIGEVIHPLLSGYPLGRLH